MEFLVIVISLFIVYLNGPVSSIQNDRWYSRWVGSLRNGALQKSQKNQKKLHKKYPAGYLVISLLVPLCVVVVLDSVAEGSLLGLGWLVLNVVLVLYAFGRENMDEQLQVYVSALQRNDAQAAFHDASIFNVNHQQSTAGNWDELHQEALAAISYRYFEHYFAVIFWYSLLGAPAAVLYRLSELHADLDLDEDSEKPVARKWLWMLEWLPARLMGLTLSAVGNFSACFSQWQASLLDRTTTSAEVLMNYLRGAMDTSEGDDQAQRVADINMVKTLYTRTLVLALSVVALLVIFI